jgi:O-antigen/teichoic acid export membrane protein
LIALITKTYGLINRSELARRVFTGAGWGGIATIASSGFNLLTMLFMARLLGKEQFGYLVAIQTTLGLIGVLAGFGLGTTATRYIAELKTADKRRLGRILALTERVIIAFGLVAAVLIALLAPYVANKIWHIPELSLPLTISAVTVLATAVDSYQKSVLIGLEAMQAMAIGNIVAGSIAFPFALIIASKYGLLGAAEGLILGSVIQFAISRVQMSRGLRLNEVRPQRIGCASEWRVLRDFSFPSFIAGMLVVPANWVCQTMLANSPNGFTELAILGVIMQWFNTVTFLPTVAAKTILPVLTEKLFVGERKAAAKILKVSIFANVLMAIPVALIVAAMSPWIMAAYGPEFGKDWHALAGAVCLAIMVVAAMPVGVVLAAGNRMWIGALMNLAWAMLYIGLTAKLIGYGASGVVASLAIAYFAHTIWSTWYATRHISGQVLKSPVVNG